MKPKWFGEGIDWLSPVWSLVIILIGLEIAHTHQHFDSLLRGRNRPMASPGEGVVLCHAAAPGHPGEEPSTAIQYLANPRELVLPSVETPAVAN